MFKRNLLERAQKQLMIRNPIRCDYLRGAIPDPNSPLDLAVTKNYLKIDPGQTADNDLIRILSITAGVIFESFTGTDLLTQSYEARCTGFPRFIERPISAGVTEFNCIQIKKTPLQGGVLVRFLKDGIFVEWPASEFEIILDTRSTYPAIFALTEWPETDAHPRPVTINLTAGFGDTFINVPAAITIGLLQHVAFMYENRGDCGCEKGGVASGFSIKSLPAVSRQAYSPYVIYSISNEWNC